MRTLRFAFVLMLLVLSGCVSVNKSILSQAHAHQPVPREAVAVYFASDSVPEHERVAILNASGDNALTNEAQMIDKLREQAGKLGANAIILGDVKEPGTAAVVAGAILGTPTIRRGQAIAIFVPTLQR